MENGESKGRVLITGANGFVGGFLVEAALFEGYEVWAGVRSGSDRSFLDELNKGFGTWFDRYKRYELEAKGIYRVKEDRIRFIDLNYENEEALIQQLVDFKEKEGGWDYVIHNAGITKALDKNDFYRVNAEYTRRLLHALIVSDCKPDRFVLMSSLCVHGNYADKKLYPYMYVEYEPLSPQSDYGKSKLMAERYVREQTEITYVILQPTGVFGPRDRDYFMQFRSISKGFDLSIGVFRRQMLSFIYVEDLATVAMLAMRSWSAVDKTYIVSDGSVCSDKDFGRMIQTLVGRRWVLRLSIPVWMAYVACWVSEKIGQLRKKPSTLNTDKFHILKQRIWICRSDDLATDLYFHPPYALYQRLKQTCMWYADKNWFY